MNRYIVKIIIINLPQWPWNTTTKIPPPTIQITDNRAQYSMLPIAIIMHHHQSPCRFTNINHQSNETVRKTASFGKIANTGSFGKNTPLFHPTTAKTASFGFCTQNCQFFFHPTTQWPATTYASIAPWKHIITSRHNFLFHHTILPSNQVIYLINQYHSIATEYVNMKGYEW